MNDQPNELYFTLKVYASDFPSENGKLKIIMDFVPEFNTDLKPTRPNFHANNVQKVLSFVAKNVIGKVVEYIYAQPVEGGPQKPKEVDGAAKLQKKLQEIYKVRREKRGIEKKWETSDVLNEKDREAEITEAVEEFLKTPNRKFSDREKNVTRIRFEYFNPNDLHMEVQTLVNRDTCPPYPPQ